MLGLGWAQLFCLVAAFGTFAVGTAVIGLPEGVLTTAPVWLGLGTVALVPVSGRPLIDYTPVGLGFVGRRLIRQDRFRRPVWRTRPAGSLSLPGSRARLRQWVDEATGVVLVHDPSKRTLAATLMVTHGQFMVDSEAEQVERVNGWARLLSTVGQSKGVCRVQVLVRSSPDAGLGVREHWHRWPDKAPAGSPARASYEELVRSLGSATDAHRSSITIVIDLKKLDGEIKEAGGGLAGAAAVMRQRMDVVEKNLRAPGLRSLGWVGPDELALIIRSAYDPARSVMLERHPEVLGDLVDAGPMAVDSHWGMVRTDSGWHKVVQIGWPRQPAAPGFLFEMLMIPGVKLSMSHIFEPVLSDKALRQAAHEASSEDAAYRERKRVGRTETVLNEQDREAVTEHLAALDRGWTDADHVALIVISAPTKEALTESFEKVRAAAGQVSARVDTVFGQQDELLDAGALPLGLGVR